MQGQIMAAKITKTYEGINPLLLRTRTVLTEFWMITPPNAEAPHGAVTFQHEDPFTPPEDSSPPVVITMDYNSWEEMNKPKTITVTIEPGDKLNGH